MVSPDPAPTTFWWPERTHSRRASRRLDQFRVKLDFGYRNRRFGFNWSLRPPIVFRRAGQPTPSFGVIRILGYQFFSRQTKHPDIERFVSDAGVMLYKMRIRSV